MHYAQPSLNATMGIHGAKKNGSEGWFMTQARHGLLWPLAAGGGLCCAPYFQPPAACIGFDQCLQGIMPELVKGIDSNLDDDVSRMMNI